MMGFLKFLKPKKADDYLSVDDGLDMPPTPPRFNNAPEFNSHFGEDVDNVYQQGVRTDDFTTLPKMASAYGQQKGMGYFDSSNVQKNPSSEKRDKSGSARHVRLCIRSYSGRHG